MTQEVLNRSNITLRPLCLNDADGDYPNWFNDKEVTKYNSHGDHLYTREMAIEYIKMVNNSDTHVVYAIEIDKKHIGNISLQNINKKNRSAEFAILIGNLNYHGKDVGYTAASLLLNYGFTILKLHRIYCGTSIKNIPMQKLALKLGMKQEGICKDGLYKDNQFIDTILYAKINELG